MALFRTFPATKNPSVDFIYAKNYMIFDLFFESRKLAGLMAWFLISETKRKVLKPIN